MMFLAGLEIDFSNLGGLLGPAEAQEERSTFSPLSLAFLSFIMTLVLSGLLGFGLQYLGLTKNAVLMALILSTTSLGVVVPVLKEHLNEAMVDAMLARG